MIYDLIIVSRSSTPELTATTQKAIDSAMQDGAEVNVIIVETSGKKVNYNVEVIYYSDPFNYNRCLNLGLLRAKGDIHILANNDIVFHKGWSVIGPQMISECVGSASALSGDPRQRLYDPGPHYFLGYGIGMHVAGWCLFITNETYKRIGAIDESVEFWYSDNQYAKQIQEAGIKHALFCNVRVDHVTSRTLRTLPYREQRRFTLGSKQKIIKNAV